MAKMQFKILIKLALLLSRWLGSNPEKKFEGEKMMHANNTESFDLLTEWEQEIRSITMRIEERLHNLLVYHDQLIREQTNTCFANDQDNQEYSSYLKDTLRDVNNAIKEILLQDMPF